MKILKFIYKAYESIFNLSDFYYNIKSFDNYEEAAKCFKKS